MGEVFDLGVVCGLVVKLGVWYFYQGDKIGQGKVNVVKFLEDNLEIVEIIEMEICNQLFVIELLKKEDQVLEEV